MKCADQATPEPYEAKTSGFRPCRRELQAAPVPMLIAKCGTVTVDGALHYAPNHNFDAHGTLRPAQAGFNLADVTDPGQ